MKKRWMIGAGVLALVVLYIVFRGGNTPTQTIELAKSARGDVRNEVSVTGRLKPLERIDLAFTAGGRVDSVMVADDAHVLEGDVLVRLDTGVLEAQAREAEARLARERALEADLLAPLRTEERAVKDSVVASAEATLAHSELSARTALARAYSYADDAIREEVDELFYNSRGPNPKFGTSFTYGTTEFVLTADAQTKSELSSARAKVEETLNRLEERSRVSSGEVEALLADTDTDLRGIESFLNDLARAVNRYIQTDSIAQTVYEAYQTSVATARTAITTARSDVLAVRKEHETAYMALATALRDLELSTAGASDEALSAQRASVSLAEYGVTQAIEQLNNSVLHAPFDGVVTNLNVTKGEAVSPYAPIGQLIADAGFEIEAYIPEADIARVKLGDTARVTFDAFDRADVFMARVVRMALSETMREGVPTYRTTLAITESPNDSLVLRSGMTADMDIVTDARENVVYVPTRSILTKDGKTYVRVQTDTGLEERTVVPGLRGSDGYTEVLSGITEGDDVVLFIEEP